MKTRLFITVLAVAGCDRVFGLGDPYEDARSSSDAVVVDVNGPADTPDIIQDGQMPPHSPFAHFSFDTNFNDDSGAYIGTDYGDVILQSGHLGSALTLNGGSCISINLPQTPSTFTIAFWARAAVVANSAWISRAVTGTSPSYAWRVYETQTNSGFGFEVYDGKAEVDGSVATQVTPGIWHHYAVSYDGMNKRWWLDGAMVNAQSASSAMYGTVTQVFIGCDSDAGYFSGQIDELSFYDGALGQGEIQSLASP